MMNKLLQWFFDLDDQVAGFLFIVAVFFIGLLIGFVMGKI